MSHEEFLHRLKSFSHWIAEKSRSVKDVEAGNVQGTQHARQSLEFLKASIKIVRQKPHLKTCGLNITNVYKNA